MILRRLFNRSPSTARFQLIEDKGNGFYSWNGSLYKSDIVRACIRPKAKAVGKLLPKHIRNDSSGIRVNPDVYMKFLLEEPNPYMSGQMLLEKITVQLQLNNNAFVYICRDDNGYPVELYFIPASSVDAIYDGNGMLFLKCLMQNGKTATYSYSDVIHIRQDYNVNDIFGDSPSKSLKSLMDIVNVTDQGMIRAIKNGGVLKWLLKFNSSMRPDDIDRYVVDFTDKYLSIENTGGAAGVDNKAEAIQLEPKDYVPNAAQTDRTIQRLYSFFNTNEKIVQSKYDEDEWNAYYESEIEPLAIQLSNEFTRKLFTRRERGFGNKIVFEASNLQYSSMSTKLSLVQRVDRGAMLPNEWREVLGLGPIEGGNKPIRRLDTEVIKDIGGDEVIEH